MGRIKCFLVEDTGKKKIIPPTEPCSCGDPLCDYSDGREERVWRRADTGAEGNIYDREFAPAGAMWFAPWYTDAYKGLDGRCLVVRTPGGDWIIDSVASNCTKKDDTIHKCWVREGEAPEVTVGKGGNTCAAGAGSILINGYHGFLRNGHLEDC